VDAGDLIDGGILGANGAQLAWQAAGHFGIDIAVPGNHEFDWGAGHFRAMAESTGLPYICANADLGFPATRVVQTDEAAIGFIGITYPLLEELSPGLFGSPQPPPGELVPGLASALRVQGCDFVVAVIHDGVTGPVPVCECSGPDARCGFLGTWYRAVDAVIAGHTLYRAMATLDGVPICQPEPYGAEIGIIRFGAPGGPELDSVRPQAAGVWDGVGADELARASSDVLANVPAPILSTLGEDNALLDALAESLRSMTGADAALVSFWDCFCTQPVRDGVVAYVPAGPFSRADLFRLSPEASEPVAVTTMSGAEFDLLRRHLTIPFLPALGCAGTAPSSIGSVAITGREARRLSGWFGRTIDQVQAPEPMSFTDVWLEAISRF
jgi:2',3'-cyclic-nucleotide 2'-phosphodiesterase (5'-nucleotidase family)